MKKIELKKLDIRNFKGARSLVLNFTEKETNIYGDNGTCKTTCLDSFLWCLFDKNAEGDTSFGIKPVDSDNNVIPDLENSVEAVIHEDGYEMRFKKVHVEKWTRPRGQSEKVFSGHEVTYFYNDVPMKKSEYQVKVEQLCTEKVFKIITNPMYFTSLKWEQQRDMLFKMAGIKSDMDVAVGKKEFEDLLKTIGNKTLVEFKKEVNAKKKKLKEELEHIPARISEIKNSMPTEMPDFEQIEKDIADGNDQMKAITEKVQSEQKRVDDLNKEVYKKQSEIKDIETNIQLRKQDIRNGLTVALKEQEGKGQTVQMEINTIKGNLQRANDTHTNNTLKINSLKEENKTLVAKYEELNKQTIVFDESKFACPTCKRELEQDDIEAQKEQMLLNFNNEKAKKVNDINTKGLSNKTTYEQLEKDNVQLSVQITEYNKQLKEKEAELLVIQEAIKEQTKIDINILIEKEVYNDKQTIDFIAEKNKLSKEVPEVKQADVSQLEQQREWFLKEISELNKKLGLKDVVNKNNNRIFELENQARILSQEIATLEQQEFTIEEFTKYKIGTVEAKINGMFSIAKFKMYEKQINGGESETCYAMLNGVPFSDVNTGGRIQLGIDIINTLCDFFKITAPIFVDNRESVTLIPETRGQIINLFKDENYKVLTLKIN